MLIKLSIENGNNITVEMQNLGDGGADTISAKPDLNLENDQEDEDLKEEEEKDEEGWKDEEENANLTFKIDNNRLCIDPSSSADNNQDSNSTGGKSTKKRMNLRSGKGYTNWADLEAEDTNRNPTEIDKMLSNIGNFRKNSEENIRKYKKLTQNKLHKLKKTKKIKGRDKTKANEREKIKDPNESEGELSLEELEALFRKADAQNPNRLKASANKAVDKVVPKIASKLRNGRKIKTQNEEKRKKHELETLDSTKKVIKACKPIDNVHGDTDIITKRKLKLKTFELKVSMPDTNRFIPGSESMQEPNKSPNLKIYTPTPTRMLMNLNRSDNISESGTISNQFSNKFVSNINMESPSMFLNDSRYRGSLQIDDESLILPSPTLSMNNDTPWQNFYSSKYYPGRDDDIAILNLSPYVLGPSPILHNQDSPGFRPFISNKNINET